VALVGPAEQESDMILDVEIGQRVSQDIRHANGFSFAGK
jgi:hypothetical protein